MPHSQASFNALQAAIRTAEHHSKLPVDIFCGWYPHLSNRFELTGDGSVEQEHGFGEDNYVGPLRLRNYQVVGRDFLYDNMRALLTDPPGAGKTAQAAYAAVPPVLIAAPKYLTEQWYDWLTGQDEQSIERNHGEVIPNVIGEVVLVPSGGYSNDRFAKTRKIRAGAPWTIVNHEMFRTHKDVLLEMTYKTVILDESHHFKTHSAKQSKAAVEIAQKADRVYQLTGTPIMREVDDLYNQLRILQPTVFTSYNKFVSHFCVAEYGQFGVNVLGVKKEMIPELEGLLNIVRLGRSYKDIGRELPPVIEKIVKIELPPEVRKIYDQVRNEYRNEWLETKFLNYSQVYNHLRQIVTGSFKIEAVTDLLADETRKSVIFSWYRHTAGNIAEALGETDCELVTGADTIVERRQKALGSKHVSATITALSEGIDLSDARTVVFAEENWTPGSNFQAKSRVVRERVGVGADNSDPVVIYYVMCARTIDEVIHARARARSGTIRDLIHDTLGI